MTTVSSKDLHATMSKRLANFKLSDAAIKDLADRVLVNGLTIGKFNPCIYGICIDYFTDKMPELSNLSLQRGVAKWEVFPYGIIDWDRFHVQIAFNVDELQGKVAAGGFGG
jgi:hypothetical protein